MESHMKPVKPVVTKAPSVQVGQGIWFVPYCEGEEGVHLAAIVCKVNEDATVNVCVFTPEGRPSAHSAIPLIAHEEDAPESDFCCPVHAEGKKPARKKGGK